MKKFNLILWLIVLTFISACGQKKTIEQNSSNFNVTDNVNSNIQSSKSIEQELNESEKFKIKNYLFTLNSNIDGCQLIYKKGEIEQTLNIELPSPCHTLQWYGMSANQIFYSGKRKRFIQAYDKFPRVRATIFVIIGGAVKSEKCKDLAYKGFQVMLVRDNEIKRSWEETTSFGCESGLINYFFDGPTLQFAAEEEKP